jgi:hypothetical protein
MEGGGLGRGERGLRRWAVLVATEQYAVSPIEQVWADLKSTVRDMPFNHSDAVAQGLKGHVDAVRPLRTSFRARLLTCVELNGQSLNRYWGRIRELALLWQCRIRRAIHQVLDVTAKQGGEARVTVLRDQRTSHGIMQWSRETDPMVNTGKRMTITTRHVRNTEKRKTATAQVAR